MCLLARLCVFARLFLRVASRRVQVRSREAEQQRGAREVDRLLRQHVWLAAERHVFGRAGSDYDFGRTDCEAARRELAAKQAEHSR